MSCSLNVSGLWVCGLNTNAGCCIMNECFTRGIKISSWPPFLHRHLLSGRRTSSARQLHRQASTLRVTVKVCGWSCAMNDDTNLRGASSLRARLRCSPCLSIVHLGTVVSTLAQLGGGVKALKRDNMIISALFKCSMVADCWSHMTKQVWQRNDSKFANDCIW